MLDEMVEHALVDLPNECCGLIAGKEGTATKLYRARNGEPIPNADGKIEYRASPYRYYVHPLDQLQIEREIDDNDWTVLVVYHSHVASEAYPSPTDVRMARLPTEPPLDIYPGAYYVLVSLKDRDAPVVRAFQIHGGEVTEEAIEAE